MSKTILVDGNSLAHAAHHGTKLTANGMEVQAIYGMVNSVAEIKNTYPDHAMLMLWDSRADFRFDLLPEYKGKRTDTPEKIASREALDAQKPYIQRALTHLGVKQIWAKGYEADDLAGHFVTGLAKGDNEVVLLTGDRDWLQLMRPNVKWRDWRDDSRQVTTKNFEEYTGYSTPFQFLEAKALQGDTSDNIKGVGGIGEIGAKDFLNEFGSVLNFWKLVDSGKYVPKKKAHIHLASPEGRAIYRRNFRLMNLLSVKAPEKSAITLVRGKIDKEGFTELCEELSFMSFLGKIDRFMTTFK